MRDRARARVWFSLAERSGNSRAGASRRLLETGLSAAVLGGARERVGALAATLPAPPGPPDLPRAGDRSGREPLVREIPAYLKRLGYDPGPLDGSPGPRTRSAIRRFEHDRGCEVTGIADTTARPPARPTLGAAAPALARLH